MVPTTVSQVTLPAWLAPVICDDLIRYGDPCDDGGYPIPQRLLDRTTYLISAGLGYGWDFEADVHTRYPGMPIDVYDYSVGEAVFRRDYWTTLASAVCLQNSLTDVQRAAERLESYRRLFSAPHVTQYYEQVAPVPFIWGYERNIDRNLPKTHNHASIDTLFWRTRGCPSVFLKMDIDDGEWARLSPETPSVLEQVVPYHDRIVGMALEVHSLGTRWAEFEAVMRQLLEHFVVCHVHANNEVEDGSILEIVLGRTGLIPETRRRTQLPLAIDRRNNPQKPEHTLVFA